MVRATMSATSKDGTSADIQTFHIQVLASGAHGNLMDKPDSSNPKDDRVDGNDSTHHSNSSKAGVVAGGVTAGRAGLAQMCGPVHTRVLNLLRGFGECTIAQLRNRGEIFKVERQEG